MKKKCKVVSITTNKKAQIHITPEGFMYKSVHEFIQICKDYKSYHLYITSDDKIKEGDYYLNTSNNKITIHKALSIYGGIDNICNNRKIISTTDSYLYYILNHNVDNKKFNQQKSLPQPSQSFIKKYVDEYNNGNIITEVMVEYEEEYWRDRSKGDNIIVHSKEEAEQYNCIMDYYPDKLKVSKDNTVTITKVKDNLTWKEVELMLSAFICEHCPETSTKFSPGMYLNKWIEENL